MEKLELSNKFISVEAGFEKMLEELAVVRGDRDRFEGLLRFIVSQSVDALGALIDEVGTHLVDDFHARLEGAYTGSKPSFRYALTHTTDVEVASFEVQSPNPHDSGDGGVVVVNLPTLALPEQLSHLPKDSGDCSKRNRRYFLFIVFGFFVFRYR